MHAPWDVRSSTSSPSPSSKITTASTFRTASSIEILVEIPGAGGGPAEADTREKFAEWHKEIVEVGGVTDVEGGTVR